MGSVDGGAAEDSAKQVDLSLPGLWGLLLHVSAVVLLGAESGAADHAQRPQHAKALLHHRRFHLCLPESGDSSERCWYSDCRRRRSSLFAHEGFLLEEEVSWGWRC